MSNHDPQPGDFVIRVRSLKSSIPEAIRLRRWLKIGLRAFHLRCIEATVIVTEQSPTPEIDTESAKGRFN